MPISFGSNNEYSGVYIRANLPQNRWWVVTPNGDEKIEGAFAIDIKNVTFGWLHIDVGVRSWEPWPSPSEQTPRPSDKHKNGFEVTCWVSGAREAQFSGNSYGLGSFIAKLYNQCEVMPEFEQGKVPVVAITSSTPVVIGKGTSYDVGFQIVKWIDRPAGEAAPAPAPEADANDFGF